MNAMEFNQAASFLSAVQAQVTGASSIATITPANFVSTATTLLQTGADTIMDAVSQVLSRTIFSVRPYYAKFPGMMTDEAGFGNHVRKIQFVDSDISDDDRYLWPVGYDSVSPLTSTSSKSRNRCRPTSTAIRSGRTG